MKTRAKPLTQRCEGNYYDDRTWDRVNCVCAAHCQLYLDRDNNPNRLFINVMVCILTDFEHYKPTCGPPVRVVP